MIASRIGNGCWLNGKSTIFVRGAWESAAHGYRKEPGDHLKEVENRPAASKELSQAGVPLADLNCSRKLLPFAQVRHNEPCFHSSALWPAARKKKHEKAGTQRDLHFEISNHIDGLLCKKYSCMYSRLRRYFHVARCHHSI